MKCTKGPTQPCTIIRTRNDFIKVFGIPSKHNVFGMMMLNLFPKKEKK